jgi:peptidylprolyl isomerase domain and WD repeat-containing protein 1
MCVDETDSILIYPTFIGIKFVDLKTGNLVRLLGKTESSQRFMRVTLY